MGLAIFDIDGTLVAGPSTEKRFFWRLLRRGVIGPRRLAAFLLFNLRWLPRYGRHVPKKNKAYLTGLTPARLQAEAAAFVAEEVVPVLYEPAIARLRRHRAAGDTLILLSGTLQPIAEEIGRLLDAREAIGSLCDVRDGRLTARPPSRHPFAGSKSRFLDEICARYGETPETVSAYGDSADDLPLLERVGTPVAVRPDKRLRAVAGDLGWESLGEDGGERVDGASGDTI